MIVRYVIRATALGALIGYLVLPTVRAADEPSPVKPAITQDAATAVTRMGQTLSAREFSFTARTVRAYLDESRQPLHIVHSMNIVVRRPDRLAAQVTGDDGAHDVFYDGKSVTVFSPESNEYATIKAPADIASALNEAQNKLGVDLPLAEFFTDAPDQTLMHGVIAGWQVGTAKIDGVECEHLFFTQKGGIEVELWVERNSGAVPHRLIVTYRLLPGQPSFIAEFTNWDSRAQRPESTFLFQPPVTAKKIELNTAFAPAVQGSNR
jgi:hypothetical protein